MSTTAVSRKRGLAAVAALAFAYSVKEEPVEGNGHSDHRPLVAAGHEHHG